MERLDCGKPYEVGEVVTLRRFTYIPRKAKRGAKNTVRMRWVTFTKCRKARVVVKVTDRWPLISGNYHYTAELVQAAGKVALWLKRAAPPQEQRIIFSALDVILPRLSAREITADDYSPIA